MRLKDYGTKVTTLSIMGEDIDVFVTNQGQFKAADPNGDDDDEPLSGSTLDDLTKAIRKALTKKKAGVAVDITILDYVPNLKSWDRTPRGRSTFDCVLRGVHARTRAAMLRSLDGKLFQMDTWGGDRFIMTKRLTDAEKAAYLGLARAVDAAQADLDAWLKRHRSGPDALLAGTREPDDDGDDDD